MQSLSLRYMLNQYETLKTLSIIAEESPKPTQYQCTPREMILNSSSDWDKINRDLLTLQSESLVQITQADTIRFSITDAGIRKIHSLEGRPLWK
ncbi:MAG: hypothetical protein V4557_12575 [Bacteroidota bacterium]